jgi:hypothetical protein
MERLAWHIPLHPLLDDLLAQRSGFGVRRNRVPVNPTGLLDPATSTTPLRQGECSLTSAETSLSRGPPRGP